MSRFTLYRKGLTHTHGGGKRITDIKIYSCGYCVNRLHWMFKEAPREKRRFPATAVFFRHNGGAFLFDTGYFPRVERCGWRSRVYKLLNPMTCRESDSLAYQLAKDGVTPADITGIILSHLHPDHIGGLRDFPGSKLYLSSAAYQTGKKPSPFDLVFPDLLPDNFDEWVSVLDFSGEHDLFGDGSLLLRHIPGHSNGQLGMFLPEDNIFFAADSCWGSDLLDKEMRFFPKFLQRDYAAYQKTLEEMKKMRVDGIRVIFSHEVRE